MGRIRSRRVRPRAGPVLAWAFTTVPTGRPLPLLAATSGALRAPPRAGLTDPIVECDVDVGGTAAPPPRPSRPVLVAIDGAGPAGPPPAAADRALSRPRLVVPDPGGYGDVGAPSAQSCIQVDPQHVILADARLRSSYV